ncbi:hypothetical protein B4N84_00510, partial [Flavobacterium sp. IR1]
TVSSVSNSLIGDELTILVNGVSTVVDLKTVANAGTTNSLILTDNTIESVVNGKSASTRTVSSVSNSLIGDELTILVNGVSTVVD